MNDAAHTDRNDLHAGTMVPRTRSVQHADVSWYEAFVSGLVSCSDIAGVHRQSMRSSRRLVARYMTVHEDRAEQMLNQRTRRLAVGQFVAFFAMFACLAGGTALILAGHSVGGTAVAVASPVGSVLAAVSGAGQRARTR